MFMKFWKIYGEEGHRQKQSFGKSFDSTTWDGVKYYVVREDLTKTNEYVLFGVVLDTPDRERADDELKAQIYDGIFEGCRVGKVEELFETEF